MYFTAVKPLKTSLCAQFMMLRVSTAGIAGQGTTNACGGSETRIPLTATRRQF
jgi:hypothetical protein